MCIDGRQRRSNKMCRCMPDPSHNIDVEVVGGVTQSFVTQPTQHDGFWAERFDSMSFNYDYRQPQDPGRMM